MTKADKILFVLLTTFSVLAILFTNVLFDSSEAKCVVIESNGEIYGRYPLDSIKDIKVVEIKTKFGYNKVGIYRDGAEMLDSDCRDEQCRHTGKITNGGQIICLPNKCIVRIETERGIDGVSY